MGDKPATIRKTFNIPVELWATIRRQTGDVSSHLGMSKVTESQQIGYILSLGCRQFDTLRACARVRDLSYPILSLPDETVPEEKKPTPGKVDLQARILELRSRFEDQDQLDRLLGLMAHHLKGTRIAFSRQVRLLEEWTKYIETHSQKEFQEAADVILERQEVPRKPEPFFAKLLKDGVNHKATPKQTAIPEPAEWTELRRNWIYIPDEDMFAPKLRTGKPDWASPRKPRPEGMPKPR